MEKNPLAALALCGVAIVASVVHDTLKVRREQKILREKIIEDLEINLSMISAAQEEMTERIQSGYYSDKSFTEFEKDLEFAFGIKRRS